MGRSWGLRCNWNSRIVAHPIIVDEAEAIKTNPFLLPSEDSVRRYIKDISTSHRQEPSFSASSRSTPDINHALVLCSHLSLTSIAHIYPMIFIIFLQLLSKSHQRQLLSLIFFTSTFNFRSSLSVELLHIMFSFVLNRYCKSQKVSNI
jgi:hypothetical protein